MNKKGAIELSMTTIIIIILGVILLVFGIGFITNIMTGASGIADKAIEGGQQQVINILGSTKDPLTLYSTNLDLEQGGYTYVGVVILNDQGNTGEYKLETVMTSSDDNDLDCYIAEVRDLSEEFSLASGRDSSRTIVIEDAGNTALGLYGCTVKLTRNSEEIAKESILVNVVESGGLF
ncbi:MAG: hypothetical protein ABIJ18_04500 [archaeon]